jgi:hypothetical protein
MENKKELNDISSKNLSECSKELGIDLNNMVNENYKKLLLKMEDLDSNAADITEYWQVVSWLYKKHKIWISVDVEYDKDYLAFWYSIKQISKENVEVIQSNDFSSPEEAYNAAFEYLRLNNIKQ